ncbi:MAG: retroviral-like aspartic protease family protein [Alphaproteobacteria bacterium]|nr:retroviral-like aspartic protease family protein [Alphaproteobacteria bacterium]
MREPDPYDEGRVAEKGHSGIIGWALGRVGLWGGIALGLYVAVAYGTGKLPNQTGPASLPAPAGEAEAAPVSPPPAPPNSLVFRADRLGHVHVEAAINGTPLEFIVDTGASYVALSRAHAAAAGIGPSERVFNTPMRTANGNVRAAFVTLREVRLGQLTLYDVPAVVSDNLPGSALLGMSFLNRLQSYEMRDGVLTLNW